MPTAGEKRPCIALGLSPGTRVICSVPPEGGLIGAGEKGTTLSGVDIMDTSIARKLAW